MVHCVVFCSAVANLAYAYLIFFVLSSLFCSREFFCRSDPHVLAVARAVLELILVRNGSVSVELGLDFTGVNSFMNNSFVYFVYALIINTYINPPCMQVSLYRQLSYRPIHSRLLLGF